MAMGRDEMFVVQDTIQYFIADILGKWDNEKSRIMIESFKRKMHCLLVIWTGLWSSKYFFFKSTFFITPEHQHKQLRNVRSVLDTMEYFF